MQEKINIMTIMQFTSGSKLMSFEAVTPSTQFFAEVLPNYPHPHLQFLGTPMKYNFINTCTQERLDKHKINIFTSIFSMWCRIISCDVVNRVESVFFTDVTYVDLCTVTESEHNLYLNIPFSKCIILRAWINIYFLQ